MEGTARKAGGGGSGDAAKPVTLKIGLIPIADVAPVFLGRKKGFFDEQKIKLDPQFAAGGAAITPAVISGDFDIGFSNTVSLLIAGSKNLPVQIISQGVLGDADDSKVWEDLLVKKGGPIKEPKDLEGKTIAVNTLNNICGVTINASLEKQGVDISKLKYTEIPFPEMNAALEKGRVDGACVVEPFVSQGKAMGMTGIDPFYFNTAPNLTVATYFASKEYIAKNKDVVDRFVTRDEEVARLRAGPPGRGPRRAHRVHRDPARGGSEDQPAAVEVGADDRHDRAALLAEQEVRADRGGARPQRADSGVSCGARLISR